MTGQIASLAGNLLSSFSPMELQMLGNIGARACENTPGGVTHLAKRRVSSTHHHILRIMMLKFRRIREGRIKSWCCIGKDDISMRFYE